MMVVQHIRDPCLQDGDTTAQKCGPATVETPSAGQCEPSPMVSHSKGGENKGGEQTC